MCLCSGECNPLKMNDFMMNYIQPCIHAPFTTNDETFLQDLLVIQKSVFIEKDYYYTMDSNIFNRFKF